jgi:FKBP-type peptidyl-prolyl cis-trans isomerase FkpA
MKYLLPLLMLGFLVNSCAKKKAEEQAAEDDKIIQQYLTDNGLTATKTSTGLYYIIETQGTGPSCISTSDVKVAYKGYFTDGSVFDESSAAGITFNLQGVIAGWTEGIPFFKEGGKGKLLLPSALGYGKSGTTGIPKNSVLIFDIELLQVL